MHLKAFFHDGGISYRRWNETANGVGSNGEYTNIPSSEPLSIYSHAVISEELLDQKFEGLDYDTPEIPVLKAEVVRSARKNKLRNVCLRYFLLFAIGLAVGVVASIIELLTNIICSNKYLLLQYLFNKYSDCWNILITGGVWCFINGIFVFVAASLTIFVAPVARGSGIPLIKCYLNGLNVPFVLRGQTMLVKMIGIVLAICGGLIVGKEGPMIHIGAVIAAGFSQGRLTWCNFSCKVFRCFRNDPEKRDFVSAGAAAGVAAAFGAPIGGILFTLEEGASFIFQRLTWNILFTSMTSVFALALFRSLINSQPFSFKSSGLMSFGMLESTTSYNAYELSTFVLMGIIGGLVGAVFVTLNKITSKYRQAYMKAKPAKIIDAVLISIITAMLGFALLILMADCRSGFQENFDSNSQILCTNGEYNRLSGLLFTTPSKALQVLLHNPPNFFNPNTLLIFISYSSLLGCVTYGVNVPCGLFIPSLLIGASWGRLIGDLLHTTWPTNFPDPSKFALIGAAAQLGGIVRMVASLAAILMEATGSISLGLPILITIILAKYVGDYFTEGIYDMHINLAGMALVPWEISPMCLQLRALDVMTTPAIVLDPIMSVGDLYQLAFDYPHHAFPVVEGARDPGNFNYGQLIGVMPASYIALMIKKKIYMPLKESENPARLTAKDFDDAYPRFHKLKDVLLSVMDDEFGRLLDLRPYMNPSPYSVSEEMSMTRVFALFRLLGLRHLPVVDKSNQVRGIITRKDLCRFRIAPTGQMAERLFSNIY